MSKLEYKRIGRYIELLTDYHSNGSYKTLKNNVELLPQKNYAIMIRTLNFERNDFSEDLIYVDKHAYEYLSKSKVFPNDILTNKIANPRSIYIMPDLHTFVTCGMNLFLIRFSKEVNQRYMYYCMKNSEKSIKELAHGTTTKTITKDDVRSISLFMHTDINEQNKIEQLLTSIDKKIDRNNKINDNLEQQVKLLYDYWFTQFDFPDESDKPYYSSGGKMVWNHSLKRNIPEGWEVQSIISNHLSFVIKPGVEHFDTKIYLATADVKGTSISAGTLISYEGRESRANMQPSVNSVWFAKMKKSMKHLCLNKEMLPIISNSILSTGFCGLQCEEISFEYIASYISNSYFETHKDMLAHGATQEAVNNDDLAGVYIVIPKDSVLQAYHNITQPIYAQISKNICENQELTKLHDWLLPMLMNGQATISD
ncbi:MAG: restriction endonuclease subunit S [Lachnospiraceae bacterium]